MLHTLSENWIVHILTGVRTLRRHLDWFQLPIEAQEAFYTPQTLSKKTERFMSKNETHYLYGYINRKKYI